MKAPSKRTWAIVLICLLTFGGLVSAYQTLFDLWMTAYPYADASVWAGRLYLRLATTIIIAILWTALAVWLWRQRRNKSGVVRDGSKA
jgi:hypothetical protein